MLADDAARDLCIGGYVADEVHHIDLQGLEAASLPQLIDLRTCSFGLFGDNHGLDICFGYGGSIGVSEFEYSWFGC